MSANESKGSSSHEDTSKSYEKSLSCLTSELLWFDFEKEVEEAMNEPLPEIKPQAEDQLEDKFLSPKPDSNKPLLSHIVNINKTTITPREPEEQANMLKENKSSMKAPQKMQHFKTPMKTMLSIKEDNVIRPRINPLKTPITRCTPMIQRKASSAFKPNCKQNFQFASASKPVMDAFPKIIVNKTEYIVLKTLGIGGSSVVHQCINKNNKEIVAIKCVSLLSFNPSEGYLKEVEILKKLKGCDRIIQMFDYEVFPDDQKLYTVLEIGSADLSQILRNFSKTETTTPPYMILFYWMEMLQAVQQIHSIGIVHTDLKPANFLLVDGRLKLIDFGISTCVSDDRTSVFKSVMEGTGSYISPEAINEVDEGSCNNEDKKYRISYKADVWSLGCILYQLIYRRTPFQHIRNQWKKFAAIRDENAPINYPSEENIPERFIKTAKSCLVREPKSRPSVEELLLEYDNSYVI